MAVFILILYNLALLPVLAYSIGQLSLIVKYLTTGRHHRANRPTPDGIPWEELPPVTVQLPIYNERYVVERLIDAVANLHYPAAKLEIQVLDDSTDETVAIIARRVAHYRARGVAITHLRRPARAGFKAGALAHGLVSAKGEFVAIFDADFVPDPAFLLQTIPHFSDPAISTVQTRWTHLNEAYSLLTRVQGFGLDAHFVVEQNARNGAGLFMNFNGTAGIWRKAAIEDAGGWRSDTLTEDLDLSYRAQLRGWQMVYRADVESPAELPVTMEAIRSQQYRWMKGAAECCRILLRPLLTTPGVSLTRRVHGLMHLVSSSMFVLMCTLSVLSVPVLLIRHQHPDWAAAYWLIDGFQGTLLVSLVFYGIPVWQNKSVGWPRWLRFMWCYPLYVSLMLGLAWHNSRAVIAGFIGWKTPFVRTPKFNVKMAADSWTDNAYLSRQRWYKAAPEGMLSLYFMGGIGLSVYMADYRMLVFHGLLAVGYGLVFIYSLMQRRPMSVPADAPLPVRVPVRRYTSPDRMNTTPIRVGWVVLSTGLFMLLGYGVPRDQFPLLLTLYTLLFWGYWLRIRSLLSTSPITTTQPDQPDRFLFLAAVGFRLALLFVLPTLSDDYARFVWDGRLLIHGYNPYLYRPVELVGTPLANLAGLEQSLFLLLNSPGYYSVYPPVNQALFAVAVWLSPTSVLGTVVGLRVFVLLAELGSLWLMTRLLRRAGQSVNLALLYGLNPLIILEGTGNLHVEAVMIFFVLLAVWLFVRGRNKWSAGALALAVGTKLIPVMLFPLMVRYLGWKRGLRYSALTGLIVVCLFLPFAGVSAGLNIFASLDLYFEMFEFNASLYPLIRQAGNWLTAGSHITTQIGLLIVLLTTGGIGWLAGWGRRKDGAALTDRLLFTLTLYFAFATTVHPWYITSLVAASVFTRFRYPLIWSGLIWLSYATYRTVPYEQDSRLMVIEYGLVLAFMLYELKYGKTEKPFDGITN